MGKSCTFIITSFLELLGVTMHAHAYSGFSGVTPNYFPWMVVWMCKSRGEKEEKRNKMQRFLSVADRALAHKVGKEYSCATVMSTDQLNYGMLLLLAHILLYW